MADPARTDTVRYDRDLTEFLSYRILRVHHAMNAQAKAILDRCSGITIGQWRVIAMVGAGVASTARDITRKSKLDPAFVSRTISRLEAAGLLTTSRTEADRRTLRVDLTPAGREIFERTLPHMQARQQGLVDALSPAERDVVFRILDKLELAAERREFAP